MTLNQILKAIYQNYAVVFPAVGAAELSGAVAFLTEKKMPVIPDDYQVFLSATDGLLWNGLHLYSLSDRYNEAQTFKYSGLMQVNLHQDIGLLKSVIVVGSYLEELIVYHPTKKEYQVWDRYMYECVFTFKNITDVLAFYAKDLLEK